ncbi:unnamed protein product [Brassica oleracea]
MALSLLSVFIFLQVFKNIVFAASNEESKISVPPSPSYKPSPPLVKPPTLPTTPIKPPTTTPPVKSPATPVTPAKPPVKSYPPQVKPPTSPLVKPPTYKPPTPTVKPPTKPPVQPPTYKPPTPLVKPPSIPPVKPPTAPVKPTPTTPVTTPPPVKPPVNPIPSPPVNAPPVKPPTPPAKPPTPPPVRTRIGFELGKLVLSSGLLHISWNKISELRASRAHQVQTPGLGIKIFQETEYTVVVFVAPPINITCPLNSASTLLSGTQDQNPFHFLCSEKISFSLHTPAFQLFVSAYNNNLLHLKSKLLHLLESKEHVIITGAALGGSVASLFTLWLLERVEPTLKRPLCITFGSPLIGDAKLHEILENSLRNSCFLHVAYASQTPINTDFKPFGTFLICFDSECISIDDPEAVMELLGGTNTDQVVGLIDYGKVLDRLDQTVMEDSRLMIDDVISRIDERAEKKKLRYDQLKKLNDIKISMIYIEWYKKKSKMEKTGYYDRFKSHLASSVSPFDIDIEKRKREVNDYWRSLVEEVEKKPQSEKSLLKTRSLFSGNNYRRMVEPLDIAEYYHNGGREYRASGRSRHYVMLEKWFKEEKIEPVRCVKRDLSDFLTFDSCFWSEVEEALIVSKCLQTQEGEREVLLRKLVRFEEYVWEMIRKREVSPEIFLEKSSFMKWWKEYKEIIKGFHSSHFTKFMNDRMYESYGQAC